jgi:hypothetical protein
MSKNLIKRIEKLEQATTDPRWRTVVLDVDERYHTDDGQVLTKEDYETWSRLLCKNKDTQLIIIEVASSLNNVDLKIESFVDKNTADMLKEYAEVVRNIAENDSDRKVLLKAEEILTQAELAAKRNNSAKT